jgi:hypothetical protein
MPSKKRKTKSRQTKSKTVTSKQAKKTSRERRARAPKRTVKKKQLKKKTSSKRNPPRKRKTPERRAQRESFSGREGAHAFEQSGDLEGLSRAEQADSESVDELVEEGNVFEAGAVAGVEEADDQDAREVHTHEVPEDDVPDEYLDKD